MPFLSHFPEFHLKLEQLGVFLVHKWLINGNEETSGGVQASHYLGTVGRGASKFISHANQLFNPNFHILDLLFGFLPLNLHFLLKLSEVRVDMLRLVDFVRSSLPLVVDGLRTVFAKILLAVHAVAARVLLFAFLAHVNSFMVLFFRVHGSIALLAKQLLAVEAVDHSSQTFADITIHT